MIYSCLLIIILYVILIALLLYGMDAVKPFQIRDLKPKTYFSIIIPFRNEAESLSPLLKSLSQLNYPTTHFEIIMVNDASTDDSKEVIQRILSQQNFQQLSKVICVYDTERVSNSPKKDAITVGVSKASYPWVVTTDADCRVPKYWLDVFDEYIQIHQPDCIAAPVKFVGPSSFLTRFQILDILSLQAATIGGFGLGHPFICNGANFTYSKTAFKAVNGFQGNNHVASGDDVFLLQKFSKTKTFKVDYLKSYKVIVTTSVAPNLRALIAQRIRWVSKTKQTGHKVSIAMGLIILLSNLLCAGLIPLFIIGVLSLKSIGLIYLIKFGMDFLLIFKSARFFNQEPVLLSYPFVSLLYPFFSVYIALSSFVVHYKWKNRTFKN